MTIIKCVECKARVSTTAASCPRCGAVAFAPPPGPESGADPQSGVAIGGDVSRWKPWLRAVAVIGVLLVPLVVIAELLDWRYSDAKNAVRAQLVDPDSANFRDLESRGWTVCGWVNAKNGHGGYTGFKRFAVTIYGSAGGAGTAAIDDGSDLSKIMLRPCTEPELSRNP